MEEIKEGRILIRVSAVYLLLFALLYLVLGIITAAAKIEGLGAAHGSGSTLVIILAYGTAILSLAASVIGFRTAKGKLEPGYCRIIGIVIAAISLVSVIYIQITENKFEFFDMIVMACGIFYLMGANKIERS